MNIVARLALLFGIGAHVALASMFLGNVLSTPRWLAVVASQRTHLPHARAASMACEYAFAGEIAQPQAELGSGEVAPTSIAAPRIARVGAGSHLGTPRDLLGSDGTVRWSAAYTAWGKIHEEYVADTQGPRGPPTVEDGAIRSPFRLLGQYFDEETGLSATRFRMWEAETGRWLSPDPIGAWGGRNLFALNGSPSSVVDPTGLAACKITVPPTPPGLPRNVTIQPGQYSRSEIDAAIHMGQLRPSSTVVLRPPSGQRAVDGATSDLVVDGRTYDVYTPTTGNPGRIIGGILDKNNQARGVVVDLRQTTATSGSLGNVPARLQGAINAENQRRGTNKVLNIQDIVFLE